MEEDQNLEQDQNVETQEQFDDVEERARAQGWVPKEEWNGEGKWRSAEEFLDRGELFAKIDQVRRENRELRKTQEAFSSHLETVRKAEYKRALEALKEEKKQALLDGDAEAVIAVDERVAELREAQRETPAQVQQNAQQIHPEFAAWVSRNPWYASTPHMRVFADQVGAEMQARGVNDPETVLKEVEARVRKEFPTKFANPNRSRPGAVESASGKGGNAGGKETVQLTPMQRQVMERLVRAGVLTKEEYMADIKARNERE